MERISVVASQLATPQATTGKESLTIFDNRTGKKYDVPITDDTIRATDLKKIRPPGANVLRAYDPGYLNTCCCISRISFIDGDAGILRYRGYPIEQLAEHSTFTECAFLLLYGELPTTQQLTTFDRKLLAHSIPNKEIEKVVCAMRPDAHPMGIFIAAIAALGTLNASSNPAITNQGIYKSAITRNDQILKILGSAPTIAAMIHRHKEGRPSVTVRENGGYVENFLYMMDVVNDGVYTPNPKLVKALDVLFILHAEHELNCSTAAVRHLASSSVDVYTSIAGATGALYGPRHGGANEAVVKMLERIGTASNVKTFLEKVKRREELLMGFGHRVYKNYDPRAKIIRRIAEEVFTVVGRNPLIEVAMALEKAALNDEYFVTRKLYPNVDFYSGIIYKAMGFQPDFFPLLFTVARIAGWLSHWQEFVLDPENKIVRPFQVYKGYDKRDYTPVNGRQQSVRDETVISRTSALEVRRQSGLAW